jgi:hypothetical protein
MDHWPELMEELLGRIAHRFRRVEVREWARRNLIGLLDRVVRKNGWHTAGDTVNCEVGSFLAYMSHKGAAFIDRSLYLPRAWTADRERKAEAGVPARVRFATKTTLTKRMLARAFAAKVPALGGGRFCVRPQTNAVQYQGRR